MKLSLPSLLILILNETTAAATTQAEFPEEDSTGVYKPTIQESYDTFMEGISNINDVEEKSFPNLDLYHAFTEWKVEHNKVYHSLEFEWKRFQTWLFHDEYIRKHNAKKLSYTLGHNQFSDISNEDFQAMYNLGKHSPGMDVITKKQAQRDAMKKLMSKDVVDTEVEAAYAEWRYLKEDENVDLPRKVDWVEEGAVTPVKNQQRCGSCWAFSATGAIEGAKFIQTGELVPLSEQILVDCDDVDNGCEGGIMENAFKFDKSEDGLCSEEDYPYKGKDETCHDKDCDAVPGSKVVDYIDIPESDLKGLLSSIVKQPTSIAMQADQLAFQLYSSGVFTDDSCGEDGAIDHGVLAVGYGEDEDSGLKYITVKNSWGDAWGEKGYIRLKMHSDLEWGTCAILRVMTAPILGK